MEKFGYLTSFKVPSPLGESPNGDGTLKLVNNRSKLPIPNINGNLNPYDFKIATPVRAKYDPNPCDC